MDTESSEDDGGGWRRSWKRNFFDRERKRDLSMESVSGGIEVGGKRLRKYGKMEEIGPNRMADKRRKHEIDANDGGWKIALMAAKKILRRQGRSGEQVLRRSVKMVEAAEDTAFWAQVSISKLKLDKLEYVFGPITFNGPKVGLDYIHDLNGLVSFWTITSKWFLNVYGFVRYRKKDALLTGVRYFKHDQNLYREENSFRRDMNKGDRSKEGRMEGSCSRFERDRENEFIPIVIEESDDTLPAGEKNNEGYGLGMDVQDDGFRGVGSEASYRGGLGKKRARMWGVGTLDDDQFDGYEGEEQDQVMGTVSTDGAGNGFGNEVGNDGRLKGVAPALNQVEEIE